MYGYGTRMRACGPQHRSFGKLERRGRRREGEGAEKLGSTVRYKALSTTSITAPDQLYGILGFG